MAAWPWEPDNVGTTAYSAHTQADREYWATVTSGQPAGDARARGGVRTGAAAAVPAGRPSLAVRPAALGGGGQHAAGWAGPTVLRSGGLPYIAVRCRIVRNGLLRDALLAPRFKPDYPDTWLSGGGGCPPSRLSRLPREPGSGPPTAERFAAASAGSGAAYPGQTAAGACPAAAV